MKNQSQLVSPEGLPSAIHIEVAVLGTMLLDSIAISDAVTLLQADDFLLDSHKRIYRCAVEMAAKGQNVDSLTVRTELKRRRELDTVGGDAYLAFLTGGIPYNFNIESYVRVVRDKSLLRQGMAICEDGALRCKSDSEEALAVLGDVARMLEEVMESEHTSPSLADQSDAEYERMQRQASGEVRAFVTSGLDTYDVSHGGYALRETTVLAARPKVGKSTLLRQGVIANCLKGDYVHLFTPEMPAGQVLRSMWASVAEIPLHKVRRPERLNEAERRDLRDAKKAIADWPLTIDDSTPLYPAEMIARARVTLRKHHSKLIGLDYLQKMKFKGRAQDRHIEVTDAMVGLTSLAKNEDVALVVVSSLTEPSGKERNRIPSADDLRQSGDIKFEANTVLLIHREMDPDTQKYVPETLFIVGLDRAGSDGARKIYFDGAMQRFVDQEAFLRGLGR